MIIQKEKNLKYIFLFFLINILLYQTSILETRIISYIASLLLVINALFFKYTLFEILCLIFFFIISLFNKNPKFFLTVLLVFNISRINVEEIQKFIKEYWYFGIIIFLTIIFSARLNIIDTKYFIYSAEVTRNGLGFTNPNTVGIYYFILVSHYYFYKWEKLKFYEILLIFIGYYYIWIYALSRTNLIIGLLQTITILILKKIKILKNSYKFFPIIFYILSLLISFFHTKRLNEFMTFRPIIWKWNLEDNFNFPNFFFGSLGKQVTYSMDNGLLSIQYYYGIFALLFILLLLYKGFENIEEKYSKKCGILFLSYLMYSLSEDMLISPNFGILQIYIMSRAFIKIEK